MFWILLTTTTTLLLISLLVQRPHLLAHPLMVVGGAWTVVFSWPAAIYSTELPFGSVETGPFLFAMTLPPIVFGMTAWLFEKKSDRNIFLRVLRVGIKEIEAVTWATGISLLAIFLFSIGFENTGLMIAVTDPQSSYEAREASLKLNPSALARYSWGIVIYTFLPLAGALAWARLWSGITDRKLFVIIAASSIILLLHGTALLTGAKGNLIPLYFGLVAAVVYLSRKWLSKILALGTLVALCVITVSAWDAFADREKLMPQGTAAEPNLTPQVTAVANRTGVLILPVVERALRVPTEVALQHFRYATEVGSLEWEALPFAFLFSETRTELSSDVARVYQPNQFQEAPLSTAPTNSIVLLSAHLGWIGFTIGTLLYSLLGQVVWRFRSVVQTPLLDALWLALVLSLGVLLISSELGTLLIAHGGAATSLVLFLFSRVEMPKRPPS